MSPVNLFHWAFLKSFSLLNHVKPLNTMAVLMYHNVTDEAPPSYRSIRVKDFLDQMKFLKEYCQVISIRDLINIYPSPRPEVKTRKPRVLITLDDGIRDSYINAFPILKSLGLPATVFVIPKLIHWSKYNDHEQNREYLSLLEMEEMRKHGISFCSHTLEHENLTKLDYAQQKWQIQQGMQELYHHFPDPEVLEAFAYPFGEYNADTINVLKELKLKVAFTAWHQLNGTWDHPLKLKRLTADGRDNLIKFAGQLNPYVFKFFQRQLNTELTKKLSGKALATANDLAEVEK
jgi:peptidoglycan/xylan/chitin deacetylase (PgdA/CDA1 family)